MEPGDGPSLGILPLDPAFFPISERGREAEFQESFEVSDPIARQYLKLACPNRKLQSSSELWQVQKWKAEILDTPLGLTGIANEGCKAYKPAYVFCFLADSELIP